MENVVIIGLGGGGYTAGIYTARYGLNPIIIGEMDGGTITECHAVENFSGFPGKVSGYDIMQNMRKQAENFGCKLINDSVKSVLPIDFNNYEKGYIIKTNFNGDFLSKTVILSIGTHKYKLGIPGELEYFGKGVSYCATCDGFFYRGKKTAVIGGGNTAFIESIYLSDICEKVYLIHRRTEFRGEKIWYDRILQKSNIEIITPAVPELIDGNEKVKKLIIKKSVDSNSIQTGNNFEKIQLEVDGIFFAVGTIPNKIEGISDLLKVDEGGYIIVDEHMKTNMPGIYSAGDCTTGSAKFRQLITACSEGAIAGESVFQYISRKN